MDAKIKKKYSINTLLAVLSALIVILSSLLFKGLYETFELKTVDLRFQLRRGSLPQRQDIVFVEMDEEAIQDLGRWPWPRETFAHIIDVLNSLEAKAILFDVTFTEPSQLFIDREKLREGLRLEENKKILQDFLADSTGSKDPLAQVSVGLDAWAEAIKTTLNEAIKDNDVTLAQAVKKAGNVYLGYKLEIIHTPEDINRNAAYPQLKQELQEWARENPQGGFENLPPGLKTNRFFNAKEITAFLRRAKIYNLLNENPEITIEDTAYFLNENNLALLRPQYNDIKRQIYAEKVENSLKEAPEGTAFKEIAWKANIIEPNNLQLLKEEYEKYILQDSFSRKVGIPDDYNNKNFFTAIEVSPPILPLTNSMKQAGFLNAIPDKDGVLRKVPLFIRYKEKLYPHIALWILADLWQTDLKNIPTDKNGSLLINWQGKWNDSFRHISCSSIYRLWQLENNLKYNLQLSPEELELGGLEKSLAEDKQKLQEAKVKLQKEIKGSICLIGLTAPGTHDYNPIPLQPDYPMLGTHANILNTILQGKFLKQINPQINLTIILSLSLLIGLGISFLPPIQSLIFTAGVSCLYCLVSSLLFNWQGLLIDIIKPLSAILLSYAGINSYNFATEAKEKRWIRKAFGHYVSKNIMEEILKDPSKLKLGGQRKILTVLFSDIRGFTTYSEKHEPEEVTAILNEYLNEMTEVVFKHNGTLDKYVGDEIMAIFGAPSAQEQTDHAQRAVLTALEMMEKLKQLQEKWLKEGKEPFDIGIGINTGPMLVGNMGSTERMDYTVIGDSVNLGARIEALTRQYNNHIIIGEATYDYVKDLVEVKKLDEVKVKGKEKPALIYEVLGLKGQAI